MASARLAGSFPDDFHRRPDRTQTVLLPDMLDDYGGDDNPIRFLDAFVAQLDLAAGREIGTDRQC